METTANLSVEYGTRIIKLNRDRNGNGYQRREHQADEGASNIDKPLHTAVYGGMHGF